MRNAFVLAIVLGVAASARAIPRDQVMVRARSFAYHSWRCGTANLTASCAAGYKSVYVPGDYVGLPYDWGGYTTLFEFDQEIAKGAGAGSTPKDGVLACTAGLDCSGYVSKCWDAGHYSTSTLDQISDVIKQSDLLAGDALNQAGYHVMLYSHALANGDPVFFESIGYNVHVNVSGGWSAASGYVPRRYKQITGVSAAPSVGTPQDPVVVGGFPYSDSRSTATSSSDVLDGCAADAAKNESGPEVVYKLAIKEPGTLTASVSDDAATDVDVHLYASLSTNDCVARHDATLSQPVDCGTYYVVVDTFRDAAGKEAPGPYTLTLSFVPAGKPCGQGPPSYSPKGHLGEPCGYPGNPALPFCNENFGAEVCIYTAQQSFCSKACKAAPECATDFPGGCCKDISGKGEYYCMPPAYCGTGKPDASVGPKKEAGPPVAGDGARRDGAQTKPDGAVASDGTPPAAGDVPAPAGGDAATSTEEQGGCSCSLGARSAGRAELALLLVALLVVSSRRRG